MELEYLCFLCLNLLAQKKDFNLRYYEYCKSHCMNSTAEFSYKEDLVEFMVEILKGDKEYDFTEDSRLPALFEYVSEIKILEDREEAFIYNKVRHTLEKKEKDEFLRYYLADSYLLRFEINDRKKQGIFFFYNVTHYDNMQKVGEGVNIKVTFTGIGSLKYQGCFDFEFINGAKCYSSKYNKVSQGRYKLSLMYIVNYEHFIIEFTFSELFIEYFEYDRDSRYNWIK